MAIRALALELSPLEGPPPGGPSAFSVTSRVAVTTDSVRDQDQSRGSAFPVRG